MQSIGKCALFLLNVGNVFIRNPWGLTRTPLLGTVLIAVLWYSGNRTVVLYLLW